MTKPWTAEQRRQRALRAEPELTAAAQALQDAWEVRPEPPAPISLPVRLGPGESLVVTTHTGREVTLLPTENGMWQLRDYLRFATRAASGEPPIPAYIPAPKVLADYERVCHCGRVREPFDEPCTGCPGPEGAGKLRKFTQSGRPKVELLEDL